MNLPFGKIEDDRLAMEFSTADYTVPLVIAAIREHVDMLKEMGVKFLGVATQLPAGPSPVFKPVPIVAHFLATKGKPDDVLERTYEVVWSGIAQTFPSELEWAKAKGDFAQFTSAQADLLRARVQASKD